MGTKIAFLGAHAVGREEVPGSFVGGGGGAGRVTGSASGGLGDESGIPEAGAAAGGTSADSVAGSSPALMADHHRKCGRATTPTRRILAAMATRRRFDAHG